MLDTYNDDRLQTVKHNTTDNNNCDVIYTFGYDALGRKTTVKVGSHTLSTNVYSNDRNGLLTQVQYGNGGKVSYMYDDYDRITGIKHDTETSPRYTYEYGANGQSSLMKDTHLGRVHQTEYDLAERPVQSSIRDTAGNLIYRTTLTYDGKNRLSDFAESLPSESHKTTYTYDKDNRTTSIQFNDSNHKVGYTYDALGRVSSRMVTNGSNVYTSNYVFEAGNTTMYGAGATTPLVWKINQSPIPFEYGYDERGNIVSERRGSTTTTYAYDALGQLTRVNDPHENKTWVYEYDLGGNIKCKKRYAYTTAATPATLESTINYTYGDANWKDKLTAYNGVAITYDAIGNSLSDGTWTYVWQAGRQLKQMSKTGMLVEFKYNVEGLRVQKKVTEGSTVTTTDYTLHGKLITHQKVTTVSGGATTTSHMHFFYDNASRPAMVKYNGSIYTYVHNLQGDIVGIIDASGNLVVEYKYDAWGRKISVSGSMAATLGKLNLFRYRGYVYDEESAWYYLRKRYYNTTNNRFINGDAVLFPSLLKTSIFTYCHNNPISFKDDTGLGDYYITLNVYSQKTYGNGYGHYDVSVLSKTGEIRYNINGDQTADELTFSYGPWNKKDDTGKVTIYKGGRKKEHTKYILYDDLSQSELDDFIGWLTHDFATLDSSSDSQYKLVVHDTAFAKYNIPNKKYCGSAAATFVSKMVGSKTQDELGGNWSRILSSLFFLALTAESVTKEIIDMWDRHFS